MNINFRRRAAFKLRLFAFGLALLASVVGYAATPLSDQPLYSASNVPANLMLALSVEFPTGNVAAYTDAGLPLVYTDSSGNTQTIACGGYVAISGTNFGRCFFPAMQYLGYFDNTKCYDYDGSNNYFKPVSTATDCTGHWSGNMLNWASMTALDEFRQVLTGGYRSTDTTSTTVLQRSRRTGDGAAGNFPYKVISTSSPASNVAPSTVIGDSPYKGATAVYLRSVNASGAELSSGTDRGIFVEVSDNPTFSNSGANHSTLYYARAQVCVSGMLESNCNSAHATTDYPNAGMYPKPEGLIQQNAERIRVGAAGYLLTNGISHPNGVIRALLRDNGPTQYNGFGTRTVNANREWDATSGIFTANPDTTVATASSVTKSGAINYLNQFGYANGYETYDTLGEIYWATLAYFKNISLDASYTANLATNPGWYDGFPVVQFANQNDPIQYSCQSNTIISIGDSHTWCDSRVPGSLVNSSGSAGCTNQDPLAALAASSTDPGADAGKYTDALGALPLDERSPTVTMDTALGVSSLGSSFEPIGAGAATYNMAGLAYYAHTQDIRGDDASKPNTIGKQTIDTYTVDVLEPGNADNSSSSRALFNTSSVKSSSGPTMYWLAAKYGGFNDVKGDGKPANVSTWWTNGSTGNQFHPDNYFQGNRPDLIQTGLQNIFSRISSKKALAASPPSVSATRVLNVATTVYNTSSVGFPYYTTKYTPGDWTGDVIGAIGQIAADASVAPVSGSPSWSAQLQLDTLVTTPNGGSPAKLGWDTGRRVVTYDAAAKVGVPFRYASFTSTMKGYVNSDSTMLDYLRGDRTNEGLTFRIRTHTLGDIVDSSAVQVQGALSPYYSDSTNPGYSAFATSIASRAPVVYVGANDGMLHAFAADFSLPTVANPVTGGGSELFAYAPNLALAGPTGSPKNTGMWALSNLTGFTHHFYVDQTPQVADVDFGWTCTTLHTACTAATPDWHTILVGGLGKGGKGVYALDVTSVPPALDLTSSPGSTAASESQIKNKVLWEFKDTDLGYTYGSPLVVKTRRYGWVVMFASGYNNTGKGYLYVLSAKTGTLLDKVATTVGTAANPSGLNHPNGYTKSVSDATIEQIYAGDLLGNVWRFDVSSATVNFPAPVLLATLTDSSSAGQPITTSPRIEVDINSTGLGTRRWVFVGTGKFLDTSDLLTTQQQTMYALRDGDVGSYSVNGGGVTLPLTRTQLVSTGLTTAIPTLTDTTPGWYYDLPGKSSAGATERIVVDPDTLAGTTLVTWASLVPTDDPCGYQGALYAANYGTGETALQNSSGSNVTSISLTSAVTGSQIVFQPNGSSPIATLLYGVSGLQVGTAKLNPSVIGTKVNRTNWREILN